jgi:hypothetical protein
MWCLKQCVNCCTGSIPLRKTDGTINFMNTRFLHREFIFQHTEFKIWTNGNHEFNLTNLWFQLHDFTIYTSWIRDFNFTNSNSWIYVFRLQEFTITTSRFQLHEFTLKSRINEDEIRNSCTCSWNVSTGLIFCIDFAIFALYFWVYINSVILLSCLLLCTSNWGWK